MKPSMARLDLFGWLGVVVGLVMPVLSALLYPVYMHQMQPAWAEWTRLMELPFVACELAIILVALKRGYRDALVWQELPKDVVVALILLFIGLIASSVFTSKNIAASATLSVITLVHLRFAAAIFFLARSERGDVQSLLPRFGFGLILGLGALVILTVWKFQLPPPEWMVPGGKIEWALALPGFIHLRHFGSWTGAIAAGLMLGLLYGKQDRVGIYSLCYLLAAGMTCWSGTRAAVLAMGAVALIALISMRRLPDGRALIRVGGLSALAMLGAIAFWPGTEEFSLFIRNNLGSADAVTSGRLGLWEATFARWLDAPLFGWGSGSTFWEVYVGWRHTQPHNTILLFLISWGIVGTAGALWLLGRAIVATYRIGMNDDDLRPIAGTLYALLSMSLFEGMLHYPRFIMLIMICFAVLFAARAHADDMKRGPAYPAG
jgi:O-antigen ligase